MKQLVFFFLILIAQLAQAQETSFAQEQHPEKPIYSQLDSWSALPFREDAADVVAHGEQWISDSLKEVDVFYVHPTIYQKGPLWNAGLDMRKVNRRVDKYPAQLQASVFNKTCRVYAPRYRQAVVKVFHERSADGDSALNLAYQDVKRAFEYYLEHYNNGRPFIIAGHSQGTFHARRLLREMIDTTVLMNQLVAAYVIGFGVNDSMYQNLQICSDSIETGCYVSWMSYKEGYDAGGWWLTNTQSVNPLSWTTDTSAVHIEHYKGSVVLNPKRKLSRPMTVRIVELGGKVLYVKTKAPWFRMMKNLHVADYGLFYRSIRRNVEVRTKAYFSDMR